MSALAVPQETRPVYDLGLPAEDGVDEPRVIVRIVFEIAVLNQYHVARRQLDSLANRRALARVRRRPASRNLAGAHIFTDHLAGPVRRAVVHHDNFLRAPWRERG